jgi:hypothetical protein
LRDSPKKIPSRVGVLEFPGQGQILKEALTLTMTTEIKPQHRKTFFSQTARERKEKTLGLHTRAGEAMAKKDRGKRP